MNTMGNYIVKYIGILTLLFLVSCIENDIPYPYREGTITAFQVEGQLADAEINRTDLTVAVSVGEDVDLDSLRILQMSVTNEASIAIDSARCLNYKNFPRTGFASLDSLPKSADTRVDFSSPLTLTLSTYQDYVWKITVTQELAYQIAVENQFGTAVIDKANHEAIVYVVSTQKLDEINITEMVIGGSLSTITPDPSTVHDFSRPQTFEVKRKNGQVETWKITVLHTSGDSSKGDLFAMSSQAVLSGNIQQGKTPVIEYKREGSDSWQTVAEKDITLNGSTYQALLTGLTPGATYAYRVTVDGNVGTEQTFSTVAATELTNGSFEDWWLEKDKIWNPWKESGTSFWDTGNDGATTLGDSNSYPTTETATGSGKAAKLESRFINFAGIGKFAAGNIFTGEYVRTDGTNGVLAFGRPFTSFPTSLKFSYKYTSSPIDYASDEYASLKGKADTCSVYIALTDWDTPYEIRTKPSNRQLFDPNDKHVIAYAEMLDGKGTSSYKQVELKLDYRYQDRTPKYIVIVVSSSKYGDFFTGGTGSTLWIDEMELGYE